MIDENMVERVARAMAPHAFRDNEPDDTAPDYWRSKARKAIEAMNLDTIPIVDIADIDRAD